MITLNFTVNGQNLVLTTDLTALKITSDSINNVRCVFTFDSSWDDKLKRVYFKNTSFNILSVKLMDDDACFIPWECLAHTGVITCTVVGSAFTDGKLTSRFTTNTVSVLLQREESIIQSTFDPTGTEFEQLLALLLDYSDILYTLRSEIIDFNTQIEIDKSFITDAVESVTTSTANAAASAEAAGVSAQNAANSADIALTAQNDAEEAQTAAELARDLAENAQGAAEAAFENVLDAVEDGLEDIGSLVADGETRLQGVIAGGEVSLQEYVTQGSTYATNASLSSLISEGYANGKQNGTPVISGTYFHNNSKYFSERASDYADAAANSAAEAATSVANSGIIEMQIDANGHLVYTRTEVVAIDFDINSNGHLIVKEAS